VTAISWQSFSLCDHGNMVHLMFTSQLIFSESPSEFAD